MWYTYVHVCIIYAQCIYNVNIEINRRYMSCDCEARIDDEKFLYGTITVQITVIKISRVPVTVEVPGRSSRKTARMPVAYMYRIGDCSETNGAFSAGTKIQLYIYLRSGGQHVTRRSSH